MLNLSSNLPALSRKHRHRNKRKKKACRREAGLAATIETVERRCPKEGLYDATTPQQTLEGGHKVSDLEMRLVTPGLKFTKCGWGVPKIRIWNAQEIQLVTCLMTALTLFLPMSTFVTVLLKFCFKKRRDHGKKILCASRLWFGRR